MTAPTPDQMRALQTRIHGFDHHPSAYTPEWMHTLADRLEGKAAANDREHAHDVDLDAATRALRAAADQLNAVQLQVTAAWDGGYAIGKAGGPSLNPFLTADTEPQEDRDE